MGWVQQLGPTEVSGNASLIWRLRPKLHIYLSSDIAVTRIDLLGKRSCIRGCAFAIGEDDLGYQ